MTPCQHCRRHGKHDPNCVTREWKVRDRLARIHGSVPVMMKEYSPEEQRMVFVGNVKYISAELEKGIKIGFDLGAKYVRKKMSKGKTVV